MASSSSSSSSACFHDVPETKYDVFISFRGEDIRSSFLSHLVKELHDNQIDTYVDERLHSGDEISSALLQAIEEASISLVIFSQHYASSKWCLDELEKIIQCMERHQRIVIPVFFNVDPSDVRHQKRTFEEAFDKHQDKFKENMVKVKSWRSALKEAANLSGFHYPSEKYKNESELIEEITKDISEKLCQMFSSETKGLVGIDEHLECIESLLAIESKEVRILGIWGMKGIGKTTIVEAVFDKYSSRYEGCCFLKNVREESQKHGLPYLFQKLISQLLQETNILLEGLSNTQLTSVKRRLSRKKVFIVLDDLNTSQQFEHLIGEQIFLGPGSKVIVISRDKQILTRMHRIYEVQGLNFENSLQLFCLNAFSKIHPEIGYEKQSEMVVGYANGIPLALKVLGSFLHSRSIEAWESALRKLKLYPNMEIFNVLRLSYDALDDFPSFKLKDSGVISASPGSVGAVPIYSTTPGSHSTEWVRREEHEELLKKMQDENRALVARLENTEKELQRTHQEVQRNNQMVQEIMRRLNFQFSDLQSPAADLAGGEEGDDDDEEEEDEDED